MKRFTSCLASTLLLASCMSVDPPDAAPPTASLAFRLADTSGAVRLLASRTCSLRIGFRTGTGAPHDTVLAFGTGHWLSPSISAAEDWRIELLGTDSTGHRLWTGSGSGTYRGTATVATTLWTDIPVAPSDSMPVPALSATGAVDFPLILTASAAAGSIEWSIDSLRWTDFPAEGLHIDSNLVLWARTRDTQAIPSPESRCIQVALSGRQVDRPTYTGDRTGLDFPLTLPLDSIPGTVLHWSLDTGRTWKRGSSVPMEGPGLLLAYATRPHQPSSDTLALALDGTVTPRTLTDSRDGKTYKLVRIGTQVWMAQNLDHVTDSSWAVDTSICRTGIAPSGCSRSLGRYYTWNAAMGLPDSSVDTSGSSRIQGICPFGSHLPAASEWTLLQETTTSAEALAVAWPNSAAPYLGLDSFGFTAYPAAYRSLDGRQAMASESWFWSTEPLASGNASAFGWPPYLSLGLSPFLRGVGIPVRCLMDSP